MPPGTGDAHLSLFEKYIVDGICLVSTDSPLACADLERSIDAYKSLNAPILGLVQNMANIFNHGLIEPLCKIHDLKILDKIDFKSSKTPASKATNLDIALDLREFL
jgi:MinD superfamily P-loop ATPase